MFAGDHLFTKVIDGLSRLNRANEFLARVRVLTGNQPLVLLALDFSLEFPFFSQTASPPSVNLARFAVVILSGACVFLLVVVLGLPHRKRPAHGHHRPTLLLIRFKVVEYFRREFLRACAVLLLQIIRKGWGSSLAHRKLWFAFCRGVDLWRVV